MKVAVVRDGMSFDRDASHEIGPSLGMAPENEECRLDAASGEGIEDRRRRIRVGTIVERQRNGALTRRTGRTRQRSTEERTISMKCTVRGTAKQRGANGKAGHHTSTAT